MFPSGKPYNIHTNTVEGYFSVFQTGHERRLSALCRETSSPLYLAEFDFRLLGIDDIARADVALRGAVGKRLTYQTICD